MIFYIAAFSHALIPAAVIAVFWFTAMTGAPRRGWLAGALICGVAAGVLAALGDVTTKGETAADTILQGAVFLANALGLVLLLLLPIAKRWLRSAQPAIARLWHGYGIVLVAVLVAFGVFDLYGRALAHGLTTTTVVNTDLILNCAAILIALALLVILAATLNRIARKAGAFAAGAALGVALLLALVVVSGAIVQSLLRLEWIAVTAERISYAAQLSLLEPWQVYGDLALGLGLVLVAFTRRIRATPTDDRVARRLQTAQILAGKHWRSGLLAITGTLLGILLFQDLYASLPPTLSPAVPVDAGADDHIRIPIEQVRDGKLYRFAYVTPEGHQLRFFLINRYDPAHVDIGVAFDACMICGDSGYIQRGDEIICASCNVRIFRPSIGKPGGCNPIPLAHTVEKGAVVIALSDLKAGAQYFPEIIDVEVKDPVTGQSLINRKAPFQYEVDGQAYFFASQDSYDKFRAAPQTYIRKGARQ